MKSAEEIRKMMVNKSSRFNNITKRYLKDIEDEIKAAANLNQHKIIYIIDQVNALQNIVLELVKLGYKVKQERIFNLRYGDYTELHISW